MKRKVWKIVLFVILGLLVFLLLAAGTFLLSLRDSDDPTPEAIRAEDETLEVLLHRTLTRTLGPAKEQEDLCARLDWETLNRYLFAILTHLKPGGLLSFRGAYCVFEEDGILRVELPVRFSGTPTCLRARVVLENGEDRVLLTLKDAKLGRFDCTSFLVRKLILTRGLGEKLEKALMELGLRAELDMDRLTVRTTHEDLTAMVAELTKNDPNAPLYRVLSDLCLSTPELLEIAVRKDAFEVLLHTGPMTYDPERDGQVRYPLDMESVREQVEGVEALSPSNVALLYNGFVKGYENLGDEEKETARALGVSGQMRGIRPASPLDVGTALLMQKPTMPFAELAIRGSYSIRIESRTADAILGNLPFVGSTLAFCDGKKTAYVTLEYMAMVFSPDALRVWGILNLNGRRILLDIGGSCPPGTGESLQVGVKRLAFGSYALKEGYIPDMLAWLRSVLSNQEWIVPEPESGSLYLNLSGVLDSLGDFTLLRRSCEETRISLQADQLRLTWKLYRTIAD